MRNFEKVYFAENVFVVELCQLNRCRPTILQSAGPPLPSSSSSSSSMDIRKQAEGLYFRPK